MTTPTPAAQPPAGAIHRAVTEATENWLAERRARVEPFVRRHFGWRGALRLNRRALGKDLFRMPANVLWSVPYLTSRLGAGALRRAGLARTADRLQKLPPGLKTDVEREVEWLIFSELLELPFEQKKEQRRCERDSLFEAILAHPSVTELLLPDLLELDRLAQREAFRTNLENHLRTYTASRTAAADLSGALLNLAAGAAAFAKFTPGALSVGSLTATVLAHHLAVSGFVLGPTLGSLYYAVFPVSASAGLLAATTGGLLLALGVLTSLSGVVTDPLQQALGLHRRRLNKLLDALEDELQGRGRGLQIHDAYVARVFDLWDLLQTAVRTLR